MKVTLIISVYKNIRDLSLILESLQYQSFQGYEVIISEDGEDLEMNTFIKLYNQQYDKKIIHVSQPDTGWRKNQALNKSIRVSTGDYLIFIDGDCLLHPKFIEQHVRFSRKDRVLAGKRVKLGPDFSDKIRNGVYPLRDIGQIIPRCAVQLKKNGALFIEEAFYFNPYGMCGIIPRLRRMKHLKGCNMSFHRVSIERINGFDEDYCLPAVGEDADLGWRFRALGFTLFSMRNIAVQYHLYHHENWNNQDENLRLMKQKMDSKTFFCKNGLQKTDDSQWV